MISINNLHYQFQGATTASLKHIDLQVPTGSLFGLLGPNGAGKTTLLSIISGLLPCPKNCVNIDGLDISQNASSWQSQMALVPQEYAFYDRLSVRENLTFFAAALGLTGVKAQQRIHQVVETTSLHDHFNHRAETLSGGLKRRLNLAIGLLNEPRLLLLDEPTVGIDPHSRHFILEAIRQLNRNGTTVVYTSHYMEEIQALCDQIAIIDHGQVLVQGPLSQLLEQQHRHSLHIALSNPLTAEQRADLPATAIYDSDNLQLTWALSAHSELYPTLTKLQQSGVSIQRLQYGAKNLEELFLNLTHRSLRD